MIQGGEAVKVYKRICLYDHTITDDEGTSFTLKRGTEYTTSGPLEDGTVMVFSQYWVRVPLALFGGEVPL